MAQRFRMDIVPALGWDWDKDAPMASRPGYDSILFDKRLAHVAFPSQLH